MKEVQGKVFYCGAEVVITSHKKYSMYACPLPVLSIVVSTIGTADIYLCGRILSSSSR